MNIRKFLFNYDSDEDIVDESLDKLLYLWNQETKIYDWSSCESIKSTDIYHIITNNLRLMYTKYDKQWVFNIYELFIAEHRMCIVIDENTNSEQDEYTFSIVLYDDILEYILRNKLYEWNLKSKEYEWDSMYDITGEDFYNILDYDLIVSSKVIDDDDHCCELFEEVYKLEDVYIELLRWSDKFGQCNCSDEYDDFNKDNFLFSDNIRLVRPKEVTTIIYV